MFDVLAVIMEYSITSIEAIAIMVVDSTMVRRLLAVVGSATVSATSIDIEVVNTAGGSTLHSATAGRRELSSPPVIFGLYSTGHALNIGWLKIASTAY